MEASDMSMNDAATMRPGGGSSLGRIDQYELVRELGGGGFGTVYLARDAVSGVEVAVKGLPPMVKNNREELANIRSNFALVSRLTHTNIAKALVLQALKNFNRESGVTIVMVSSELEELRQSCDRIAIVSGGKIAGILPAASSVEELGSLMLSQVI